MSRSLEVADIFRAQGAQWREAQAGHLSLGQLKVMSAIEHCRTAQLGGHVLCCERCGQWQIAYNSCRNRHCPKCQGSAAARWLAARQQDLLPVLLHSKNRQIRIHNGLGNIDYNAAADCDTAFGL